MTPEEIHMVIERVRAGETEAYGALVREHQHGVWRVAAFALREPAETEDLVQQAFVTAYQRLDAFDRERDFGAWVRGIARNLVRDQLRRRMREHGRLQRYLSHLEALGEADDLADAREERLRLALAKCREALSADARAALTLRYEQASSFARVGEALGRTVPAARQLLQRTRAELRLCIEGKLA